MITITINPAYDLSGKTAEEAGAALIADMLDLSISPQDSGKITVGNESILKTSSSAANLGGNAYRLTYTINYTSQDTVAKTVVVDFTSPLSGTNAYGSKPSTEHDVTVTRIAAYDYPDVPGTQGVLLYEISGIQASVSTNSLWDRFSNWRQVVLQSDALTVINHPDGDGNVITSPLDDSVVGGSGVDNVETIDGNDTVAGGGGNDTIHGGNGNDLLEGGTGDDEIRDGDGDDMIDGGAGNDRLYWGSPADGAAIQDTVHGGDGDDLVSFVDPGQISRLLAYGEAGNDTLEGAAGDDSLEGGAGNDILRGGGGNDSLIGGDGDDLVEGGDGNDRLTGGDGADTLQGGAGADSLIGGAGNDNLEGGAGADTLDGGAGNDRYTVDTSDTIRLSGSIEDYSATWNGSAFVLTDRRANGDGVDTISGSAQVVFADNKTARIDSLLPSLDLVGTDGADDLQGSDGYDTLTGGAGDDWLRGFARADRLDGGLGNDTLDGGTGADTLIGGAGDDLYLVDAEDSIVEATNGGTDTVRTAARFTLATNVENLEVLADASAGQVYTGNDLANRMTGSTRSDEIRGGDGADTLVGGGGYDTLNGGAGDDRYDLGEGGAVIQEAVDGGHDLVVTRSDHSLAANVEDGTFVDSFEFSTLYGNGLDNRLTGDGASNTLSGLAGNDTLVGGAGNDSLSGGAGADHLEGGTGDDWYEVDASDVIVEAASGGADTILSWASLALGANLENGILAVGGTTLTGNALANMLTGNLAANVISGGDGSDTLQGDAGNDQLLGGTGNDSLDGGVGNDTLEGGTGRNTLAGGVGNDVYRITSTADRIVEVVGGGTDRVETALSHTLAANVEALTLTGTGAASGTGNSLANTLSGNAGNNLLSGGDGSDTLRGGAGNDRLLGGTGNDSLDGGVGNDTLEGGTGRNTLAGGVGNDIYQITSTADRIVEVVGGGTDRVETALSHTLATEVESLVLTGTGATKGTGNQLNNSLVGNAAANTLSGLGGNDTLAGGAGNDRLDGGIGADRLSGGSGSDVFLFRAVADSTSAARDTITDFADGDRIDLSLIDANSKLAGNQVFTFLDGASAASKAGSLYYSEKTGILWGDVNGDNKSDLSIRLAAGLDLDKGDFLL